MMCPKCHGPTTRVDYHGVIMRHCGRCRVDLSAYDFDPLRYETRSAGDHGFGSWSIKLDTLDRTSRGSDG